MQTRPRIRTALRIALLARLLVITLLISVTLPTAVSAQATADDWHVNDDPTLTPMPTSSDNQHWYLGTSGDGYGGYRWTYAIGGDLAPDNVATWEFGARLGTSQIEVYVPCNHATATVTYVIRIGKQDHPYPVDQSQGCGWASLGTYVTNGNGVRVTLADNASENHYRRDGTWSGGYTSASIAVDAMRVRCTNNCAGGPPEKVTPLPTNLRFSITPATGERVDVTLRWDTSAVSFVDHFLIEYARGDQRWGPFRSIDGSSHRVSAPANREYMAIVRAVGETGKSREAYIVVNTTYMTPSGEGASQKFIADVRHSEADLLALYQEAARTQCFNGPIRWQHIAAVAMRETLHGRYDGLNFYNTISDRYIPLRPIFGRLLSGDNPGELRIEIGDYRRLYGLKGDFMQAVGPFQFLPTTWEDAWTDTGGDDFAAVRLPNMDLGHGTDGAYPDPQNFRYAAHAAAAYLCHQSQLSEAQYDPVGCAAAFYYSGVGDCRQKTDNAVGIREYVDAVAMHARDYLM